MAAAAYGAVGSLMHLLDNLQHPSRQQLHYDRDQIKTLSENATFLLAFLEEYSEILCQTDTEDLARQLAYAVDEAEGIIDCHVVDQLSQRSAYEGLSSFREDMDNVLNKIESIKKEYSDILCHADTEDLARRLAYAFDEAEEIIDCHVVDQLRQRSAYEVDTGLSSFREDMDNVLNKIESIKKEYSDILCHTATEDLVRRLAAYAFDEAEEIIDCHVVEKLSQRSAYEGLSSFREDMDNVHNKIESIKKELMLMVEDRKLVVNKPQQRVSQPIVGGSSTPPSSAEINKMVGFDERLVHIMDQLTGYESDLQIIPITGMGGIGKTTLARNAFDNRCILDRFDLRKWITISQSYSIQDVLLGLLGELDHKNNYESSQSLVELGEKLHKMLFGRRYIIVMDDMWDTEVWDKIGLFFPNNENGSRIVVTTRLSKVADSLGSVSPYLIDFLDEEKSWKLFCIKAFGKEVCTNPEFEEIGKSIVKCCKGLPLTIVVIGRLLGRSNMTREDWELVAKDVTKSLVNSKDDEDCSNILFLSYKHLPIHLKPCFLYMRVFPEDYEIDAETLINYWIAEGFVNPKGGKTLEDIASEYLKDLIDRNLILIHEFSIIVNQCKMHDLLRDLCKREYERENFFCFSKVASDALQSLDGVYCFLCFYRKASEMVYLPNVSFISPQPICKVCNILCAQHNRLRLVMIEPDGREVNYPKSSRVRYLRVSCELESTSLSLLWNLRYLETLNRSTVMPVGILCEMPQLRTLITEGIILVDPPVTRICSEDYVILENIQTFEARHDLRGSEEILKRIPNVKTLEIGYDEQSEEVVPPTNWLHNVVDLHKLEWFYCTGVDLECMSFPNSLKILGLADCICPWQRMTIIGSLPNLEFLMLSNSHGGPEWNPIAGEFLQLKTLWIRDNDDLVWWNAEKYHFPKLQNLDLDEVEYLEKIPQGIGEIEALRKICLTAATESLIQSAKEIIEEQREYGNEELQLILY